MKVLFISNDPSLFESDSPARSRMRAYAGYADQLHVLSRARPNARETQEGALFLHPVRSSKLFSMFALMKRARSLIREQSIDIVSAQDPFEHGLIALRAVSDSRAKLHIQVHTDFLSPFFAEESLINRIRVRIAGDVLKRANGIRTVSARVARSLAARYGENIREPSILPRAVPSPEGNAALPAHAFTFTLIAVGRLEKEKRFKDVIAALELVTRQYPNTGLFIVGEGRERKRLEKRARDLGLAGRVIVLGPRRDAAILMRSANAFIQASAYEGYGATLLEAARARIPIVTTDVGIVGEVLKPEHSALVSPPYDVPGLVENVRRLVEDNPLRHELAIAAEEAVAAHLSAAGNLPERIMADIAKCA
ncbi:MAG: glycosyltransferase [Patescibacteria group bacterium]|nr:glycosyltransferase [Patescibacteria group bacterium]